MKRSAADPIIEAKHISKQYKIGVDAIYKTLKNEKNNLYLFITPLGALML